jgi:hypothetical protein
MDLNLPYAQCQVCGSRFPVLTTPLPFDEAIRRLVCGCIFCGAHSSRVTIVVEIVQMVRPLELRNAYARIEEPRVPGDGG